MKKDRNRKKERESDRFNGGAEYAPPGRVSAEDAASVMKFYKLPRAFPKEVIAEAKAAPVVRKEDVAGRLDLRKKFIFTCDPERAKDFDDALSLWRDSLGRRVLGVHIADVSHYVRAGSAMDREAAKRSTSVYLADRVVPMLPEAISNGACSLVPGEDRLTVSVFITYDRGGNPVKCKFAKSVINSKARFTYEQVMGIIKGAEKASKREAVKASCAKTIRAINELAQQLRAKRFADGALDLEVPETEVQLDPDGEMIGLLTYPYDESHQMIEECMVAANEAVAKELWTHGVKIIARFHDAPDPEKLMLLREELRGLDIKCGNLENKKVFSQFLKTIKSSPLYSTLSVMVLRSMKRAIYDSVNMGHWGLAKRYYAHFTSPIRRYPDLTLHRQLKAYIAKDAAAENAKGAKAGAGKCAAPQCRAAMPAQQLKMLAKHATEMEDRATQAERSLVEIKKYRLLEEELNSRLCVEYEAVITKCERFGCFVDVPAIGVSGLVHISALSPRFVKYNTYDHTLSAPGRGGGSWKIGDVLRVKVARVDFASRHVDFETVQ